MERYASLFVTICLPLFLLAQAVNDEPCTAIPLTVNEECVFTLVNNTDATLTAVATPPCGNLTGADLWYTITVPATGLLRIGTDSGSVVDAAMALYSAPSCDGPFTLITCVDDHDSNTMPQLRLSGSPADSTLYLRVWGYGTSVGDFGLCVNSPPIPVGDCAYLLDLYDSYGDGWGSGASVGVSINGAAPVIYSLESGSYDMWLFGVNVGDLVTLSYTEGAFNVENGVRLSVLGMEPPLFWDSNGPTGPTLFNGVVDCQQPPPSPGDCNSATTLCVDTVFPEGALSSSFVVDLNPGNQGCLASGERIGLWTRFTVASAGTLAFTLDPEVQSDVDFAIWGPLNTISCPPVGSPIRCSYSALNGPTGLSTDATGNTEGAAGDGWVSALSVEAGQSYLLYIDNFSFISYPVALTWQLSDGASLLCPEPPNAAFTVSDALIPPSTPVNFIDQSTNAPVAWSWSFTGGTPASSTEQDPVGITYDLPGCYDVTLTSYNPGGSGTTAQLCAVEVDETTGFHAPPSPVMFTQNGAVLQLRNLTGHGMYAQVLDATGRSVLSGRGAGQVELSTQGLGAGHYLIVVTGDHGAWSHRVVVAP